MLSVKDINEVSFGKAGFSGYKPEDVDNFIDEVAGSFEQLIAERDDAVQKAAGLTAQIAELQARNSSMQGKLAILAEKVESYRGEEDGIKDAILSAQKISRDTIQEAKDKAQIIMEDAQSDARKLLDGAKIEASKAAKEYLAQADAKKEELEEVKRQVTAFRSSLLEMYKKHLECINHIPSFRTKEETDDSAAHRQAEPEPQAAEEETAVAYEPAPAPVPMPIAAEAPPAPAPAPRAAAPARPQRTPAAETTLEDKVDFSEQQYAPEQSEEDYLDDDLTGVGIDVQAYADIPETLQQEKNNHFNHLEFGDGVEIGKKKHRK